MSKIQDLHLYLKNRPSDTTFSAILEIYGFTEGKIVEATKTEPYHTYYSWQSPHLNSAGLQLIYFNNLFSDDLNYGSYSSFIILSTLHGSSSLDVGMVDIISVLLLDRYGGLVHNPQRIDKISTNYLLNGEMFSIKDPSSKHL